MSKRILKELRQANGGCRAVNVLRIASVVAVTETVTIGSDVYEAWLGGPAVTAGHIKVDLSAGGTKASQTLTSDNTNVADGETVTIDTKVYTFKTALSGVEGQVLIGADADGSLLNLIRAINHSGTPNTDYFCAAAHPTVTAATSVTSHAFAVTAKLTGTGPNSIATTETSAHLSWGAATLASGANPTGAQAVTALVAAIATKSGKTYGALAAGTNEMLLFTLKAGNYSLACTETLAGSNNAWHAAATYGGEAAKIAAMNISKRSPNAGEVTLGNMHFEFPFAPNAVVVQILVTSSGVQKAWDGGRTITGNRVTLDNTGSTDWATTDTVIVFATE